MFNELIHLTVARCQPDGAIGHAVSCQVFILAAGKGSNLTLHGHLLIADVVEAADEMHTTTVVEEQRFVVTSPCTGDMEVETTRSDHLFGGEVKQGDAVLADDQQLAPVIHVLQTERLVNIFYINDLRLAPAYNHQMTSIADGIRLTIIGSIHIPETIVPVSYLPLCRQLSVL